jgi:N-acetylglutamate synthase-like GNAT family acetyltransferase
MLAEGLVWVAEDDGALIGFAACQAFQDALHLWELAVRRDRQGEGAGRALVATAVAEARRLELPAVTLSTFRDIPWNAPFYTRLGFRELAPNALNGRLTAILMRERRLGLDAEARCAMRLDLAPSA